MSFRLFVGLLFAILPAFASAQSLPALYDVSDVGSRDVLNVRRGPSTGFEVVGTLAADATAVEVVSIDAQRKWGLVNVGEISGWASLSFLRRQPLQIGGRAPERAQCFGTEPFWSFALDPESGTFSAPGALDLTFAKSQGLRSRNRLDRHMVIFESDLGGMVSTLKNTLCSDGMSERTFGWEVDLMLYVAGAANAQMFSGCCSIAP